MIKQARLRCAAVLLLVGLVGIAFVNLNTKQRVLERRSVAAQLGLRAIEALEGALRGASADVQALTLTIGRRGSAQDFESLIGQQLADHPSTMDRLFWVEGRHLRSQVSLRPGAIAMDEASTPLGDDDAAAPDPAPAPTLAGPVRLASGAPVLLLRAQAWAIQGTGPQRSSQPLGAVVAALRIDEVTRASGLDRLSAAGYDYQLALALAPRSGTRERLLAQATPGSLLDTPVRQTLRLHDDRLHLSIAPRAGWMPWHELLLHAAIVAIAAVGASWFAFDLFSRLERERHASAVRRQRLRGVNQRLSEEVVQREEIEKQFSEASYHDALTGLPNRRYLIDRLQRSLRRAVRQPGYRVAVILLDFDQFKNLHETLGHAAGDQLLVEASRRLEACLRPHDLLAVRFSGDQFAILLYDIQSEQAATRAAERLREAMAEPFAIEGKSLFVTANFGIAWSAPGLEHADELTQAANVALAQAKATGGSGRLSVFDPATRERMVTRLQLETDLHLAIEREEFRLYFQPIVCIASRRMVGMEVLLRWQHPLEGLVPPIRFIGIAEDTGLIVPITRWVLKAACKQAREWRAADAADFYLSVNLSAPDLAQPDLCDYIESVVAEAELPAGVLRLEVTESSTIGNVQVASERLARLRRLGIPLLLDDFGTGYSSLSYLDRFKFDYLKIDRAFVSRIGPEAQNSGIVRAIIHLAADFGMKTIAEGVESAAGVEQLRALGCDFAQGYHFSKPVPAAEAARLLFASAEEVAAV